MREVAFLLAINPNLRKTKKYSNHHNKVTTIDDARNIVIKIKELEGLSPSSIHNYEKLFNDFDRYFGEKTDIASLTVENARDFVYWQLNSKLQFAMSKRRKNKKKGVSKRTANIYLTYAKSTFSILIKEKIVSENIFDSIGSIKYKEKKIETLTPCDIKKLLRSLDKSLYSEFRMYVLIHTILDSFGRINEVLSIRINDIDFDKYAITFSNTKNGKIRIVPVSKKTIKLLKDLIEEVEEFNSEYIFLTNHGKLMSPDTARKHLRMITSRIGLEHVTGFHIFRHSASEMFLKQNGSIRVLQKILDHSDLSTTSRWYAHVLDETVRKQHDEFSPLNLIEEATVRKTKTRRAR